MGIGKLFKGYAFFKLVKTGIGLTIGGILILGFGIIESSLSLIGIAIPFLLIGLVILYGFIKASEGGDERPSGDSAKIGYSKDLNREICPECGEEKMKVSIDGSGICENCGHSTRDYNSET